MANPEHFLDTFEQARLLVNWNVDVSSFGHGLLQD